MLVLEPDGAALAAAKILALGDQALRSRIENLQADMTASVVAADLSLK